MKYIILICVLILLVGCDVATKKECLEAVKLDYKYINPKCSGTWHNKIGIDCSCVETICKDTTCQYKSYIEFQLRKTK